jgi:hypothetical protein
MDTCGQSKFSPVQDGRNSSAPDEMVIPTRFLPIAVNLSPAVMGTQDVQLIQGGH